MNKKGQMGIGGIVVLFIGIVFAIALFTPILDSVGLMSNKQVKTNQSNDVTSVYLTATTVNTTIDLPIYTQSAWKQIDCPLTSVVLRNGASTVLTLTTDYLLDANAGTYTLKDTAATQPGTSLNLTYADYTYCADGYNKDAGSRGMLSLILIMTALILLGFVLEKSGVLDLTSMLGK